MPGRADLVEKGIDVKKLVIANAGLLFAMVVAGCDSAGTGSAGNDGAAANGAAYAPEAVDIAPPPASLASESTAGTEKVLKSEQVEAVFTGWDAGDYLWAKLDVEGREPDRALTDSPIDAFLQAHKGQKLRVRLDTVMADIPEAGGETEVQRVTEARLGNLTAGAWWKSLSPAQQQAATRSLEAAFSPAPS